MTNIADCFVPFEHTKHTAVNSSKATVNNVYHTKATAVGSHKKMMHQNLHNLIF